MSDFHNLINYLKVVKQQQVHLIFVIFDSQILSQQYFFRWHVKKEIINNKDIEKILVIMIASR